MSRRFDAIIIGAGQAGPSLAGRLTAAGMTVAMVERNLFGGTCVNTGCMPTKTLVASAYAAHLARRARRFRRHRLGAGPHRHDARSRRARTASLAMHAAPASRHGCAAWSAARSISGHARFDGPHTVRVGDDLLDGRRIFLNVGGRAIGAGPARHRRRAAT